MLQLSVRLSDNKVKKKEYSKLLGKMDASELINELFAYLDYQEESESGREFHPVCISNCRALLHEPLDMLLKQMRLKANESNK